ncbi:MAG: succinyl-diaminopimelate desuccinylase [Acidimicrobiales bacterium]
MTDLLARTAELVAIASPSLEEGRLADHVEAGLRACSWLEVDRVGDNLVARTCANRPRRLLLAGHLDTVAPNGNLTPRLDGDTLWGLGAADMKGGLAVMLELATSLRAPALDLTFVFYAGEEVARRHNGLLAIDAARPELMAADAAILGEPTAGVLEAGCQGVLKMEVILAGTRAHTARSWMGVNAVHRLGPLLDRVAAFEARRPVIAGCQYHESLQAVSVSGGVAANVVPDRASVVLSHRFAPDRGPADAELAVRAWIGGLLDPGAGDSAEVTDTSPAASPGLDHPLLAELARLSGAPPRAKLGWTDVAFFAERGVPAVNFGPGDPELAHSAGERVEREDLHRVLEALSRLATAGA